MSESPSPQTTEPGRIARPAKQFNRTGFVRWLPGLVTLRRYELSWLRRDLVAGLVMTTMLVPVGIAYAEASGVPGITGLYATIVPLLAYALFGPSRILVLGPDSALAALGVLAFDCLFRGRGGAGCHPGHCYRDRDCGD
jgi:hypothetical protein